MIGKGGNTTKSAGKNWLIKAYINVMNVVRLAMIFYRNFVIALKYDFFVAEGIRSD